MFSLDIPSFLIGSGITFIVVILYIVFTRPVKPVVLHKPHTHRVAGSRKEDQGVFVVEREKRAKEFNKGNRIFRKGEYYNSEDDSPLKKRYGGE